MSVQKTNRLNPSEDRDTELLEQRLRKGEIPNQTDNSHKSQADNPFDLPLGDNIAEPYIKIRKAYVALAIFIVIFVLGIVLAAINQGIAQVLSAIITACGAIPAAVTTWYIHKDTNRSKN